jgi:hypothetical protein
MKHTFFICKYIPYAIAFATLISRPLDLDRGKRQECYFMARIHLVEEKRKEDRSQKPKIVSLFFVYFRWNQGEKTGELYNLSSN